ncbi:MAG: hypothetical protein JO115_11215 [Pseudonocardiales bacterium]|nr:hypothetical protein [Pseudonocardiales bacterium]
MSAVNMVLAIPPLTVLVRCVTLLVGLLIVLRGVTKAAERIKAYTAFTDAMTIRWPRPRRSTRPTPPTTTLPS